MESVFTAVPTKFLMSALVAYSESESEDDDDRPQPPTVMPAVLALAAAAAGPRWLTTTGTFGVHGPLGRSAAPGPQSGPQLGSIFFTIPLKT